MILISGLFSSYILYTKNQSAAAAKEDQSYLRSIMIRSQNAMMMQMFNLDLPFTYANFSMTIQNPESDAGAPALPYPATDMVGVFDLRKRVGQVAAIHLSLGETPNRDISIENEGDLTKVVQTINGNTPFIYYYNSRNECLLIDKKTGCGDIEKSNKDWWFFENINDEISQGLLLHDASPSGMYVSQFLQDSSVGNIVIKSAALNSALSLSELGNFYTSSMTIEFRFIMDPGSGKKCNRVVYAPIKLKPTQSPDQIDCNTKTDLCFDMVPQEDIRVVPCEESQI